MQKLVSIVPCKDYDSENVEKAVSKAFSQAKITIRKGSKVLIKPNILAQNRPEQHSITHPEVVAAVCKLLKRKACKITIGESSAFYQTGYTKGAFKTSRIEEVAKEFGADLLAFEDLPISKVSKNKLKFLDELYLPKALDEFDLIINVPKIKTHTLMRFSGAVKNLYGVVSGGYKQLLHLKVKDINEMAEIIMDVNNSLKPKVVTVMDAIVGLDGGPASITGTPKTLGYVLASKDQYALDSIACKLIGYSWEDIPFLTQAKKHKLFNPTSVKSVGNFEVTEFKKLQKGSIKPRDPRTISIIHTHAWPKAGSACTGCGACVNYCPLKALSLKNGKAVLDKSKCIACYTCVPKCPANAIKLKSSFLGNLIQIARRIVRS